MTKDYDSTDKETTSFSHIDKALDVKATEVVKEAKAVKKAKKDKGSKAQSQYAQGTGALKIKLNPKINTGTGTTGKTGGLN